jgi:hypothetical protein
MNRLLCATSPDTVVTFSDILLVALELADMYMSLLGPSSIQEFV